MTLSHQLVTLNATTATLLTTAFASEVDYAGDLVIKIMNLDQSKHIFLGGSNTTTTSYGYKLQPNLSVEFKLRPEDELYAVAETGTLSCGIIKVQH